MAPVSVPFGGLTIVGRLAPLEAVKAKLSGQPITGFKKCSVVDPDGAITTFDAADSERTLAGRMPLPAWSKLPDMVGHIVQVKVGVTVSRTATGGAFANFTAVDVAQLD